MEGCSEGKQIRLYVGTSVREKPVCQQRGAIQCSECEQWFKSREGVTVLCCQPSTRPCQFHRCPGVKYVKGHLADHEI